MEITPKNTSETAPEVFKKPPKKSSIFLIIILMLIFTGTAGGAVYFWKKSVETKTEKTRLEDELKTSQEQSKTNGKKPSNSSRESQPEAPSPTPEPVEPSPEPVEDPYEGWFTYKNDRYNYKFKYPPAASTRVARREDFRVPPEEAAQGLDADDLYERYSGSICVLVSYGNLGYVSISAPGNIYAQCDDIEDDDVFNKTENLTIQGKILKAKGIEKNPEGQILSNRSEIYYVDLMDDTRIVFGSKSSDLNFSDYQSIRPELIKIIESYQEL